MSADEKSVTELEDARLLNFTLRTREDLARKVLAKSQIPDEDDREFLTKLLDGIDRTALSRAKIRSDEKIAQKQAASASLIASVLHKVTMKEKLVEPAPPPELPDELVLTDKVPGEDSTVIETFEYHQIMNE